MIERPCNTHFLKIQPKWFEDVKSGKKKFEIRKNDRNFETGDILVLQEYEKGKYTGREIQKEIEYIYRGNGLYGVSGLSEDYCILGIKDGKELEQKPCNDCISREQAIKTIEKFCPSNCVQVCVLTELPSVTPKQKIGRWIDTESLDSALWYACSECGETEYYATNYCPNCGVKMEVEE